MLRSGNQSVSLLYRKLVPIWKCTALGTVEILKKKKNINQAICLHPQTRLPCVKLQAARLRTAGLSNMSWISQCISLRKAESMQLSTENELLREDSDDLDRDASVPQKREQFHNKTNCATIWFPLQRSNQDDLCDPVFTKAVCISSTHVFNSTCCRLTPNKYTTCQEDEVGFDMSIPNSFRT